MDTVTVEGSRLNQTATEIGSSVSIITADDIDQLGFDFALDAVASAPGVTVNQNGSYGGLANVRIRGAQSGQTLVLIDGVPINDPASTSGAVDFSRIDAENIERIEVLKGPQSTLWGTDAIGGVVSITTKEPKDGFGGTAFGEYGSYNTFRGGASIEHGSKQGDFRLALVGTSSDGISKADENNGNSEADGYENLTFSAKGGVNLGGAARLAADLVWSNSDTDFDVFSGGAQGSVADGDNSNETEELAANISLITTLFDDRFENLFLVGYSDIDRQNFSAGVPGFAAQGDRYLYRYQGTFTVNDRNKIAFGAEREETRSGDNDANIDGLFALYEFKPAEVLTLTGGLRVDDQDDFGTETTGRIAAAYNPTNTLTLRASWGQGFKAPSIFQSTYICGFCGLTEPNGELRPETSEAFDIGLDWRSQDGKTELGLTVFDQESEDLIDFSFTAGYENIEFVESQGVELFGSHQLTESLRISGNYTYIDAQDGNGDTRLRVPEHSSDITVSYDPDGPFSGAVLVRYNGEEQNSATTTVDSWTRVDVTGSYDLNDRIELFGRIENLFDEEYQQILGYGTPDLSGSIGIRLRY
ncbi:MAG: TonB-dependent receptor [Hyphomonas sp.]|nr:TonB-dependent receptor [Hyphomonas sp.]